MKAKSFGIQWASVVLGVAGALMMAVPCRAQVTPAAGSTPPDDTPVIRVGATLFLDYTFMQAPTAKDADGNVIHTNAFQLGRSYINITGNVSHLVAFRITPDIARETGGAALNGSYVFRTKYAYAQINLDDWMPRGSWFRLGIQQTPYVDFHEGIYRYRFQGTIFAEREGYLTSSDAAVSFHTNFKNNYGDLHVGLYNGDGYSRFEANDQKALQVRGTVRPTPMHPWLRGLRLTAFYDADSYIRSGERRRLVGEATFEHAKLNAGATYLDTSDQILGAAPKVDANGFSVWATPKTAKGWEGLLRFDHLKPNKDASGKRDRTIAGVAYWFPHTGSATASLLFDYEQVNFKSFVPAQPTQRRIAVHCLVNY